MKKITALLSFVFFADLAICQTTGFSLTRPSVLSIDSIEKVNKGELFESSINFKVSKDYFPNADKFNLANPFIYFRKSGSMNLEMNYYYSVPDSTVRLVSYSWNGSLKTTGELNSLFESNDALFTKYFGNKGEEKNEKHDSWEQKATVWQNDEVYIKQFIVSSQSTNRVRVLISWK